MTSNYKVGDTVKFGRRNGEKTLGRVIKINRKNLKVETLEARGRTQRGQEAGRLWNVPPGLCELVSASKQAQKPSGGPFRTAGLTPEQRDIQTALDKLTSREINLLRNHFQKQL